MKRFFLLISACILIFSTLLGSVKIAEILTVEPEEIGDFALISVNLENPVHGTIYILDHQGYQVATIFTGEFNRGKNNFEWDRTDDEGNYLDPGRYSCHFEAGTRYLSAMKIIILK